MDLTKMREYVKKHYGIVIITALLLFGIVIPMLGVQTFLGHDVYFHMTRMEALAQELEAGNIPTRLYYFVYGGYGYASPMFYGDLFLVIPALMIMMGIPMPIAYKLFMIICVCACVLVAYYCGKRMFKTRSAAMCFAFTYAVSSYFAVDVFTRAAIGEMQAFVFIPLAFLGLHSILNENGKYWYYLPIGLACVLMSHMLTSVMTVAILILYTLIHGIKLFKNPKKILAIFACACVFLLLAANFMFPLIEQLTDTKFLSTDGSSATAFGTMEQRSLTLRQLFSLTNLIPSREPWIPNGIGYLPLVLLLFRIWVLQKEKLCNGDLYIVAGNLCLLFVCNIFPWENQTLQNLLGTMQFPWRMMLFATLFFALAAADYCNRMDKTWVKQFTYVVCALGVVAFCSVYMPRYMTYAKYNIDGQKVTYYKDNNIGTNIGTGEFLPTGTNRTALMNRGNKITTDGYVPKFIQEKNGTITVNITTVEGLGTYLDLPLINYKGYTAVFEDSSGNEKSLAIGYGANNVVRVNTSGITSAGTVTVTYSGTTVQHVSFIVSVLSALAMALWLLWCYIKKGSSGFSRSILAKLGKPIPPAHQDCQTDNPCSLPAE